MSTEILLGVLAGMRVEVSTEVDGYAAKTDNDGASDAGNSTANSTANGGS